MPSGPQDNQTVLQGGRPGRRDRCRRRLLTRCGPLRKRGTSDWLPCLLALPALPSRASSCPVVSCRSPRGLCGDITSEVGPATATPHCPRGPRPHPILSCLHPVLSCPIGAPEDSMGTLPQGQPGCPQPHTVLGSLVFVLSYPVVDLSCPVLSCRIPIGHHHRGQYDRCRHAVPLRGSSCPVRSYQSPKGLHADITAEVSLAAVSTHCSQGPRPVLSCPVQSESSGGQYSCHRHTLLSRALTCPVLYRQGPGGLRRDVTAEVSPATVTPHCPRGLDLSCPLLSCPVGALADSAQSSPQRSAQPLPRHTDLGGLILFLCLSCPAGTPEDSKGTPPQSQPSCHHLTVP